jgi:hypothetical protein
MGSSELTGRPERSHFVLMESSSQKRRFPPPCRVEQAGADCYEIRSPPGEVFRECRIASDLRLRSDAGSLGELWGGFVPGLGDCQI